MSTSMRAKMAVSSVEPYGEGEKVSFTCVSRPDGYPADGSDEDNTFARWSPDGRAYVAILNPALKGKFALGDKFYVDFTPAP